MGADGGSIAGRQELVRTRKRAVRAHSERDVAKDEANTCALTQEPLTPPVVVCHMGRLYNKEAVIEYLLAKQKFPHLSHLTALKDVRPVQLQWTNPPSAATPASAASAESLASSGSSSVAISSTAASSESASLYACPITGLPSNGANRFVAMSPCGCVVSERAWKSVAQTKEERPTCLVCNRTVDTEDEATPTPAAAATAAAAAAAASTAASTAAGESTLAAPAAAPAFSASPSSSPTTGGAFHHPAYLTLFPGPEEELHLRARLAERIRAREEDKRRAKAAKKAAAATTTTAATTANGPMDTGVDGASSAGLLSHKRKGAPDASADASSGSAAAAATAAPPPSKRHAIGGGAHASLVAAKTGNSIAESVRAITAAAAAAVAERRKDKVYDAMFLTEEQRRTMKVNAFSTKPDSLMSML